MICYCWPGNVRELENFVENIVALNGSTTCEMDLEECHCLTHDNLGNPIQNLDLNNPFTLCEEDILENNTVTPLIILEKNEIKKAIRMYNGNITQVVKKLGLSKNALYNKMKRYNINNK